jgi:hypothetical protein
MTVEDPVEVYSARHAAEAHWVRARLEEAGIAACVVGEALQGALGDIPFEAAAPRVWVRRSDAAPARSLIAQYEDELRHGDGQPSQAEIRDAEATDGFCYHCGEPAARGQPTCAVCGRDLEWDE